MYIRTKDGIYKEEDMLSCNMIEGYYEYYCELNKKWEKEYFIKQSENLEELCDGFVVVGDEHIVFQTATFDQVKLFFANKNYEIYGAIWTDKGLIYVAKMNENGELELI